MSLNKVRSQNVKQAPSCIDPCKFALGNGCKGNPHMVLNKFNWFADLGKEPTFRLNVKIQNPTNGKVYIAHFPKRDN